MIDDCHEASKYTPHGLARQLAVYSRYDGDVPRSTKCYPGAPETPLPAPRALVTGLGRLLRRRRSRPAKGVPNLRDLATLLWATQGIVDGGRTAPSAGGLHPVEVYVHAQGVTGIPDGIHHLDPHRRALEHLSTKTGCAWALDAVHDTGCRVILCADLDRVRAKYDARAYRFALLEVGHACQNLLLAATALGLDAVPVGGFFDDRVHDDLGIDGVAEVALYVVPVA